MSLGLIGGGLSALAGGLLCLGRFVDVRVAVLKLAKTKIVSWTPYFYETYDTETLWRFIPGGNIASIGENP